MLTCTTRKKSPIHLEIILEIFQLKQAKKVLNAHVGNKLRKKIFLMLSCLFVLGLLIRNMARPIYEPVDHFKNREVKARLTWIANKLTVKCENPQMAFKELLKENPIYGGGVDSWGNEIELRRDGEGALKLISRGADNKLDTKDDIIVIIQCQKLLH